MAGDVKRSLNKESREKVEGANNLIVECFALMEKNGLITYDLMVAFANFEVDMVLSVLNKRHSSLVVASTPQEACCKLIDAVETITRVRLSNAWDAFKPKQVSAEVSADCSDGHLVCKYFL